MTTPTSFNDQAAQLRELVSDKKGTEPAAEKIRCMKSLAILSGKGGVGKSNIAVNLGLELADRGWRVAILDGDLGLANIDILFGVVPKYNIGHVLRGEKEFSDIVLRINERVSLIPGGSGLRELADLDEERQAWVIERLAFLENTVDILILDTGAGIHKSVMAFALAADQCILLTTPDPTAIRDAYSMLKSLYQSTGGELDIGLLVNMAADEKEASGVANRIIMAAKNFLHFTVPYLGYVAWDNALRDSVKNRKPLLLEKGDTASVNCFRKLADKILNHGSGALAGESADKSDGLRSGSNLRKFLKRLAKQMVKKEQV